MNQTRISDDMLHAYVDGQLEQSDMEAVQAYLTDNPEKAEEMADWAIQNNDIRALFPARDHPIPLPTLPPGSEPAPAPVVATNSPRSPLRTIAASIVLLAAGSAIGWYGRASTETGIQILVAGLVQQAINAHAVFSVDQHRPVEIKADEEALLVRWLSARVGAQLTAPDLSANGFDLVGGRLLAVSEGPAAQFMYENAAGTRITIFATRGASDQLAAFSYTRNGDTGSFTWADENLRYAIVGDIPREQLNTLAIAVYDAFS